MPFGGVRLIPGLNVEKTPTLLEAGYSATSLIRFRDGLAQKYGGWTNFYPFNVSGVPRDLHAWSDLNSVDHLLVGTTDTLGVITGGSFRDITPQTLVSDFTPNFSTVSGSLTVTIVDPNITNVTINDSVLFNTPIAIGGLVLSGIYPIVSISGAHSYTITAASPATATVNNAGTVPAFTTVNASAIVTVTITAHGRAAGDTVVFPIPTTGNGVTVDGAYTVASVTGANTFTINAASVATAGGSFSMNAGNAELVYYIALGPPPTGTGYGIGGYGLGGYGTGAVNPNQVGAPITATDWTSDNWGQIALACPENGGIYYWDPTGGFANASLITSGPPFNAGMFVSTSAQIIIAYGSTIEEDIGIIQDPMLLRWCDSGNFFDWIPSDTNLARNFRIPIGSRIVAGMAVSNQNLIWTDLDLWVMNFIGFPNVYGLNMIGAGAGAASSHAVQKLRGGVYWMGRSNFYRYAGAGVEVIPCPVWDAVFQNINTAFIHNVRAMPNTGFNEAGWFYPSAASVSGENDSYIKMNISEPGGPWDAGPAGAMPRSAWIDQNVFGPPISATSSGAIYQQETTNDAAGQPMTWTFTTGYFRLAEGEDYVYVDQILPDFRWGDYGGAQTAQVQFGFSVTNYPGDVPVSYGPYTVTQATQFISVRFRGALMAITVVGSDLGSFVRLGYIRFRYAPSGRR